MWGAPGSAAGEAMKFKESRQLYERAKRLIPSGVSSVFRAFQKPMPLYIQRGEGARIYDVDGNEYIDYALGHGPLILGHCHPEIIEAVEAQVRRGSTFGCQHALEIEVAGRMLSALPWAEKVLFSNTGTEAVQVALRLARAYTERRIIVKFEGDYHGWADNILLGYRHKEPVIAWSNAPEMLATGGQSPAVLDDIRVLPWNDLEALNSCFEELGEQIAGVITEPMQCNVASIVAAPGFLERLREVTQQYNSLLIFDEVITGFRLAAGGGAEYFRVAPDIAVYGKALAGGYPLSAIAAGDSILRMVEQGKVLHAGTFNGNPVAMAAANATLNVLLDPSADVYGRLRKMGLILIEGLRQMSAGAGVDLLVQGVPACFHMLLTPQKAICNYADFASCDKDGTRAWVEAALREGIFQMGDGRWYVSTAHTEEDIRLTLERAARALELLATKREVELA
jgi:glutamate-1-semialdehyde 2,1-aminomutase